MEDIVLKGVLCHKSASDGGALVIMCGRNEKMWVNVIACWRIMMTCAHSRAIDTPCL